MFVSSRHAMTMEFLKWIILVILGVLIAMALAVETTSAPPAPPQAVPVVSPWYGVFRASEYPGGPPFVQVGSKVEVGTVVGIVEPMIMEPPRSQFRVPAGVRGTIARILVTDGATVMMGQPLMEVLPTAE
jgi:acetyl-CoA carboxylase biotin carboxyl carrier protein